MAACATCRQLFQEAHTQVAGKPTTSVAAIQPSSAASPAYDAMSSQAFAFSYVIYVTHTAGVALTKLSDIPR